MSQSFFSFNIELYYWTTIALVCDDGVVMAQTSHKSLQFGQKSDIETLFFTNTLLISSSSFQSGAFYSYWFFRLKIFRFSKSLNGDPDTRKAQWSIFDIDISCQLNWGCSVTTGSNILIGVSMKSFCYAKYIRLESLWICSFHRNGDAP